MGAGVINVNFIRHLNSSMNEPEVWMHAHYGNIQLDEDSPIIDHADGVALITAAKVAGQSQAGFDTAASAISTNGFGTWYSSYRSDFKVQLFRLLKF